MKTGKNVKNKTNKIIFTYNNENYTYDMIYNLIKKLKYHKSNVCDWTLLKAKDYETQMPCICIFFQDSRNEDWKYNFKFNKSKYKSNGKTYKFHKGFLEEYLMAKDEIKSELSPLIQDVAKESDCDIKDVIIYSIGWSLGGSVCQIMAFDLNEIYGVIPTFISYAGANICGNLKTKKELEHRIDKNSIIFCYGTDIVPRVPPIPFAYRLNDNLYYLNDKKIKFPFIIIKKLISTIKNAEYYHTKIDKGIINYMI